MDPFADLGFTGKSEERAVALNSRDGTRVSVQFEDFEAILCMRKYDEAEDNYYLGKNAISVEVKSTSDIKVGLALHLKHAAEPYDGEKHDLFYSASTCLLAFSRVTSERKLLEFEAPNGQYDDQLDRYTDFDARLKVFWEPHQLVFPTVVDKKAIVCIEEEELEVDCRILSACSEYFSGYFSSTMKEGQEGKYPISDCSMLAFAELLAVVHPCAKPVDNDNVAMLLELARLYMIPTVTFKCECFLLDRTNRKDHVIENFQLADKYGLHFTSELLLATFGDGKKFREVLRDDKFDAIPEHVKYRIRMKYIEVDMLNNPEEKKRGLFD